MSSSPELESELSGLENLEIKKRLLGPKSEQKVDLSSMDEEGGGVEQEQQGGGFSWPKKSCESDSTSPKQDGDSKNILGEANGPGARLGRESFLAGMTRRHLLQERRSEMFGIGQSSSSSHSSILGEMTVSLGGPDGTGGAVLTSSGLLDNREEVAKAVTQAVKLLALYKPDKIHGKDNSQEDKHAVSYKKVSFVYSDRAYVVVRSGNKLHVILKKVDERPNIDQLVTHDDDEDDSAADLSDDRSLS